MTPAYNSILLFTAFGLTSADQFIDFMFDESSFMLVCFMMNLCPRILARPDEILRRTAAAVCYVY